MGFKRRRERRERALRFPTLALAAAVGRLRATAKWRQRRELLLLGFWGWRRGWFWHGPGAEWFAVARGADIVRARRLRWKVFWNWWAAWVKFCRSWAALLGRAMAVSGLVWINQGKQTLALVVAEWRAAVRSAEWRRAGRRMLAEGLTAERRTWQRQQRLEAAGRLIDEVWFEEALRLESLGLRVVGEFSVSRS